MVEQARGTSYTEIVYSPLGSKFAKMNGTTLQTGYVPLTSGASAIYTASGLAYYRHTDHLGSSRFASTPTQTKYSDTAYSAFGEPYAQSGATDNSFTGQDQDTTPGVYDFLFRKYDPGQSRWTSPDPAGLAAVSLSNPQSFNRYAYTLNDPGNLVDPLGLTSRNPADMPALDASAWNNWLLQVFFAASGGLGLNQFSSGYGDYPVITGGVYWTGEDWMSVVLDPGAVFNLWWFSSDPGGGGGNSSVANNARRHRGTRHALQRL